MGENYFGITDPGKQRTNNEDSFIAQPVFNAHFIVACVIDGVGGYAGGEVAARLTRDVILQDLNKLPDNITDRLVATLENANERIILEKKVSPQNENMACVVTLAVVDIEKNIFYFAHVGDTRLYLFRDGSLIKITRDHSTVGFLEESGRLSEEAAMQHPKRNEVNKALGYEAQIALTKDFIDTGESPFLPGDKILLCSDGLTDMIPAAKIISILNNGKSLKAMGQQLIEAANDAGGKDNITVVLVNNHKSPLKQKVTKPIAIAKKLDANGNGEVSISNRENIVEPNPVIKGGGKANGLLAFVCLVLALALAWVLFSNYKDKKADAVSNIVSVSPAVANQRNQQELKLLDSIAATKNKVIRIDSGSRIIITDSINIQSDTLHIIGNGSALVRDSAYAGPAFVLSASCKYILLDSLTLENFNIGVLVLNKGLHLKNVQFKNCLVPLQFNQQLKQDTLVSGSQVNNFLTDQHQSK